LHSADGAKFQDAGISYDPDFKSAMRQITNLRCIQMRFPGGVP
jgi:hypothetical protein